ncbi:hypothetical protein I302_105707 [Kwoniella bestiolae CBS 10118]|uniref:Uncharacterized protein n=1 Tax=Kwoniella bestiolae CBS 10118 TaxID=1296100 RepID=A0A1B9G1W4_9TREE|nr:hypothetical protein I302_04827 [Kwoniella bestiolae CBS 10118]OCF25017.1 hypothetical protein I302_04827 [Kwoniella bestiolae CBS 10118]
MPHLTQSPLSSPSLRAIAHPQLRTSYFPPVPTAPHAYHGRVPPTPHSSLNVVHHSPQPNLGSGLVGCLKHSQHISGRPPLREEYMEAGPYHRGDLPSTSAMEANGYMVKPAMKSLNTAEKRRSSLKISQIPIGNSFTPPHQTSRGIHTTSTAQARVMENEHNNQKRRPSFKIELPPRPTIQKQQLTQLSHAPFPKPSQTNTDLHPLPSNVYSSPPIFRDPFVGTNNISTYEYPAGGYMILRAPTKVPHRFMDDFPSPTSTHPPAPTQGQEELMYGMEGIGLGYSLNKRVATPWLRSKGDEEEWLRADDLEGVEGVREVELRVRGLAIA